MHFFFIPLCLAFFLVTNAVAETKPNVVIFLADDQGWGDLSINGNTNSPTPNIDALARAGASLNRFYVCPVCSPTRAEFLTGRYHPRGGVRGVTSGQERLNLDEKTIGDSFKAAGYATGCFGKWHNGSQWPYHPNARGFDEYYGFTSGHWGEYFDPPLENNGQPVRGKGYIIDDFTDHAIAFIEKNKASPFLCFVPFNTPHSPFAVPQKNWDRFKGKAIAQRAREGDSENLDQTRCVLAMTENIDWNVGRVLKRLDKLKLADNTIVIYFSDNGPATYRWNGDMKGRKGTTDEGGVRVPFFIRWPAKIKANTAVDEISGAIDLLPTLTAMAGISRVGDKPLDGKNVLPLLLGNASQWPDRMIFSHHNGKVSVRTQQYRFDNNGALFDMLSDPGQRTDISQEKSKIAAKLSQAVKAWREEVLTRLARGNLEPDANKSKRNSTASADRPFPVGYAEFPRAPLPARDGIAQGQIQRSASAPNCSYFVNWTSLNDSITWDIEAVTSGTYEVEILYACPEEDAGSEIELSFNGDKIMGKVAPGFHSPFYTNQDTLPRPAAESRMKEFRPLNLGSMRLEKGRGFLTLRALKIPGKAVMDMRQVNLTLNKTK